MLVLCFFFVLSSSISRQSATVAADVETAHKVGGGGEVGDEQKQAMVIFAD